MNQKPSNNLTRILSSEIVMGVLAVIVVLALGWYTSSVTTAAWYSGGGGGTWDNRVKITIDSAQVNSSLTDFPVYVDLSDLPSGFFSNVQSDGGDIRVTKADGETELAREVVSIDTASSTGELHFKADSISSTSDTVFYIYYGNSSATNYTTDQTYGRNAVWSNGYGAVWHLAEDPSGTAPQMIDSTANGNDGTNLDDTYTTLTSSKIGQGWNFSGNDNQAVTVPDSADLTLSSGEDWAVSIWASLLVAGEARFQYLYSAGGLAVADSLNIYINDNTGDGYVRSLVGSSIELKSTTQISDNTPFSATVYYDSSASTVNLLINGTVEDSASFSNSIDPTGDHYIANRLDMSTSRYATGIIDDLMFSKGRSIEYVTHQYTNQNTPTTFYTVGSQEAETDGTTFGDNPDGDWGDTDWQYREKITIDSAQVSSNLTDFPVYVDLADLSSGFHSNVNSDGSDIRMTKADGTTELAREVVSIDTASSTGELHFKADSISSTSDTVFYIYYGNSSATNYAASDTYGSENVWSNGYEAVYHMNNDPSGSAPQLLDSTANGRHGTSTGSMTSADLVSGQLDQAIDFDGSNDRIDTPDPSYTDKLTVSAWATLGESDPNYDHIFSQHPGWYLSGHGGDDVMRFTINSGSEKQANFATFSEINTGNLHNYVGVYDGSLIKAYYDGVLSASTTQSGNIDSSGNTSLGGYWDDDTLYAWAGNIDEARVASTVRSADWISTEYTNQNTPTTFYAAGGQETQGGESGGSGPGSIEIRSGEFRGGVEFR